MTLLIILSTVALYVTPPGDPFIANPLNCITTVLQHVILLIITVVMDIEDIYSGAKKACQPTSRLSVQDLSISQISPPTYPVKWWYLQIYIRIYLYHKHLRKSCNANIPTTITGFFSLGLP